MSNARKESRSSNTVIRIVCEGEKTEPRFFTALCEDYYSEKEDFDIRTIPIADIPEEEIKNTTRGKYKGKTRQVREGKDCPDEIITGPPPLKWVKKAKQLLKDGIDEAWAVYDKDNHPTHKEAFEEAEEPIDGKKVNIAFSSRSFEYYLLLHFEYLYKEFNETDCGEKINGKKVIYRCGSNTNENDCHGENCINGYAREHGYWQDSKREATYPIVKDRLLTGLINAARLRAESNHKTNAPIFERNPYTSVDRLIGRLIGKETVNIDEEYFIERESLTFILHSDNLEIKNSGEKIDIVDKSQLSIINLSEMTCRQMVDKNLIIVPGKQVNIPYSSNNNECICYNRNAKELYFVPW